ncbi:hypothetical protein O1G21_00950 [Kitasatospora cathayae]|uniref:Uncharacterized protein n=1 Tax=Kitasatospora cathayae TaxID=3004092 RepID=A0ABY7PW14_9ACTN|nr:hypothetical protein [Kitasatospora sp. HUAS 3-15]WBP84566.1 hypothetical protein O1G21_00950 [Kitasatospora sp. HUAS 3-15]
MPTGRAHRVAGFLGEAGHRVQRRPGVDRAHVQREAALVGHFAAQVERQHADVVHVDLGAQAVDPTSVHLHRLPRAADRAPVALDGSLRGALADQPAVQQFGDQVRDGGLGQPGVLRDPGPRARSLVAQQPQHQAQIGPPGGGPVPRDGRSRHGQVPYARAVRRLVHGCPSLLSCMWRKAY